LKVKAQLRAERPSIPRSAVWPTAAPAAKVQAFHSKKRGSRMGQQRWVQVAVLIAALVVVAAQHV
jgi:hypothetical protein